MIKVVAFDLWDTLIYLDEGWKTFTQLKPFVSKDASFWREKVKPFYLCRMQESPDTFLEDLKRELGIDMTHFSDLMCSRLEYDLRETKLFSDALPALEECRKKGKKLALVSNQCSFYMPSFSSLGLNNYFDWSLFSCNLGYGKPSKQIYQNLIFLSRASPEEILMVGNDRYQDYERPIEFGIKALHLDRKGLEKDSLKDLKSLGEHF